MKYALCLLIAFVSANAGPVKNKFVWERELFTPSAEIITPTDYERDRSPAGAAVRVLALRQLAVAGFEDMAAAVAALAPGSGVLMALGQGQFAPGGLPPERLFATTVESGSPFLFPGRINEQNPQWTAIVKFEGWDHLPSRFGQFPAPWSERHNDAGELVAPEPGTWGLTVVTLAGLALLARRRRVN
ncbi:MAG: PEP-CTERM sorting domain-containing protein [Bryobacteraceae bacterium]|nr:PEP-CTERM sorting domain-containing protein [Bryobacteraceae bacterium]